MSLCISNQQRYRAHGTQNIVNVSTLAVILSGIKMDIEEFKTRLDTNGLGKYFDKLQPLLRNTIRLYQKETDENDIAIGQTKIGGRPDLL